MPTDNWCKAQYSVAPTKGGEPFNVTVSGRERWALEALIAAGPEGCTPIDRPGPQWAAYVHDLRRLKIEIDTIREKHGGHFSGTHARYVLRSSVSRASEDM